MCPSCCNPYLPRSPHPEASIVSVASTCGELVEALYVAIACVSYSTAWFDLSHHRMSSHSGQGRRSSVISQRQNSTDLAQRLQASRQPHAI